MLDWLCDQAQDEAFVALSARRLAADLGLRTVTVRRVLVTLAGEGLLHDLGRGLYALTPPTAGEVDAELRAEPHHAVHGGSGGTALW